MSVTRLTSLLRRAETIDPVDTVTLDAPLFMRLLEYAKEDAKTDVDLHNVVTNALAHKQEGPLGMEHYDVLIQPIEPAHSDATANAEVDLLFGQYKPKLVGKDYELHLTQRHGNPQNIFGLFFRRLQKFGYKPKSSPKTTDGELHGSYTGPGGEFIYSVSDVALDIVFRPNL